MGQVIYQVKNSLFKSVAIVGALVQDKQMKLQRSDFHEESLYFTCTHFFTALNYKGKKIKPKNKS